MPPDTKRKKKVILPSGDTLGNQQTIPKVGPSNALVTGNLQRGGPLVAPRDKVNFNVSLGKSEPPRSIAPNPDLIPPLAERQRDIDRNASALTNNNIGTQFRRRPPSDRSPLDPIKGGRDTFAGPEVLRNSLSVLRPSSTDAQSSRFNLNSTSPIQQSVEQTQQSRRADGVTNALFKRGEFGNIFSDVDRNFTVPKISENIGKGVKAVEGAIEKNRGFFEGLEKVERGVGRSILRRLGVPENDISNVVSDISRNAIEVATGGGPLSDNPTFRFFAPDNPEAPVATPLKETTPAGGSDEVTTTVDPETGQTTVTNTAAPPKETPEEIRIRQEKSIVSQGVLKRDRESGTLVGVHVPKGGVSRAERTLRRNKLDSIRRLEDLRNELSGIHGSSKGRNAERAITADLIKAELDNISKLDEGIQGEISRTINQEEAVELAGAKNPATFKPGATKEQVAQEERSILGAGGQFQKNSIAKIQETILDKLGSAATEKQLRTMLEQQVEPAILERMGRLTNRKADELVAAHEAGDNERFDALVKQFRVRRATIEQLLEEADK